jgi:hypothetical protein
MDGAGASELSRALLEHPITALTRLSLRCTAVVCMFAP